jgi:small subunit ribosomal protein S16
MAVRIRMTRTGRLNRPFFRIGVFDSRTRRDGRVIEQLGYYDPLLSTGVEWKVDQERLAFWMKRGALPSARIDAWLREQKIPFGSDRKKDVVRRRARSTARKAARPRTGRTVEATAKPVLPRKPGSPPREKVKKKPPAAAAPKAEKKPETPPTA